MANSSRDAGFSGSTASLPSLQLLNAAMEGDDTIVGTLLDQPQGLVDLNVRGVGHMAPLHLATERNHQNVLKRLLMENSVDVNAQDELGRTALIIAAQKGLPKMVHMLRERGASLFSCAHGGYSALHLAACHGHADVVNLLLGIHNTEEQGLEDLFPPKVYSYKSFCKDASSGSRDSTISQKVKLRTLRRSGYSEFGNVESPLERPLTPPWNASPKNGCEDMSPLQSQNCQPSKSDILRLLEAKTSAELFTPLHLAAGYGHKDVVTSLLQSYGQAVGIAQVIAGVREKGGKEVLTMVISSIIRILNSQGETYSSENVKRDILDRKLDKHIFQGYEISSMLWSSIDALVSYVNAKDCIGRTPLHHATWGQHVGVVEKLLGVFVVNVNALDLDEFTPLHLSSWKGDQSVVELLLAHNLKSQVLMPNLAAKQNKPTRARIVDVRRVQHKLGTMLLAKTLQDSYFVEERDGMTALHYAVERNHECIVEALAGLPDIDVFSVANPGTNQVGMDAPDPLGEEKSQTPLTIAFCSGRKDILQLLLKSGKRTKIMQELQMMRGYFSGSSDFEGNRKLVKEYHRKLLNTAVSMIRIDLKMLESEQFEDLERELTVALNTLMQKSISNTFTLLHHAAFAGLSLDLEFLLCIPEIRNDINTADMDNETALHFAAMEGETAAVKVLVKNEALRPNEEDKSSRTALHIATEKGWRDIVSALMDCPDVKLDVERLYRDRGVNNNAVNAILVVAALIASVTYSGWLQPPMGLKMYYDVKKLAHGDPPGTIESFAAVQQYESVLIFWIFNSLSFFYAMATVISGAAEVLPMKNAFIGQEVRMVRGGLVRTSFLLLLSIMFVLVAFGAAGFASLPPINKYQNQMSHTCYFGGWICASMLCIFWSRMVSMFWTYSRDFKLQWWRWHETVFPTMTGRLICKVLIILKLVPKTYSRFDSKRRDHENRSFRRRIVWKIIKLFKLDKDEYWRYHHN